MTKQTENNSAVPVEENTIEWTADEQELVTDAIVRGTKAIKIPQIDLDDGWS